MAIKFPGVIERKDTCIVDGYSDRKTRNAAIKDFGKYIEKLYHNGEGQNLIDTVNFGEDPELPAAHSDGGYFFEIEEVTGACSFNEETDEMEYADGHWYMTIRFIK